VSKIYPDGPATPARRRFLPVEQNLPNNYADEVNNLQNRIMHY